MKRAVRSFAAASHGTSAVEFAIVLPVLLAFTAGIVELGRAYQMYNAVNRLATRYAFAWADCSDSPAGTCATEMATYVTPAAVKNFVPQLVGGATVKMMQILMSSTGTATVTYAYPAGSTPTSAELAIAQNAIANNQSGVIVTASYTYKPVFFASLMTPIIGASKTFSDTVAQDKS